MDLSGSSSGAAVRAFWGRLGVPGLVDVHTHFMPERVLNKVWEYFDSAGELVGGVEWPITYREEEAERVRLLREEFGVLAFTSMIYPHKAGMAEWLNGWSAGFAGRTPGCLHTSTFYAEPGAAAYVRDALDAGARVFKSHVQVWSYDPGDALLDPVWGCSPRPGYLSSFTAGPGPRPGSTPGPARSGGCSRATPGCG